MKKAAGCVGSRSLRVFDVAPQEPGTEVYTIAVSFLMIVRFTYRLVVLILRHTHSTDVQPEVTVAVVPVARIPRMEVQVDGGVGDIWADLARPIVAVRACFVERVVTADASGW